jgi:CPA2 family monovalent cation:H+ antiporter-2
MSTGGWSAIGITLVKVAAFVVLMLVVGRRLFPRLLWMVAKTGSRELFTLCVIAAAIGVAYGSAHLFGVSFALGAFFAGMMMRESELSHRAAAESLPLQDAFSVLFFASVGMLFDPRVIVEQPLAVLAVVAIVMFGKTIAAIAIVVAFRYPLNTALTVGSSLAQVGEFSFILAALGVSLGMMQQEAQSLILAGSIISIAFNPAMFAEIEPAQRWIPARSGLARRFERNPDPLAELPMETDLGQLTGQVVLVGYGRVGRRDADALLERKIPFVAVEMNREHVEKLRARGCNAVTGDAAKPAILIQGHVARAAVLIIATPDTVNVRRMVEVTRMLNPKIEIVIRTHNDEEAALLRSEQAGTVFMGEAELALGMSRHVIELIERRR